MSIPSCPPARSRYDSNEALGSPSETGADANPSGRVGVIGTPQRPNTVAGLIQKHREIAGLIEAKRRELDALVFDLQALEHSIRLFDPDAQLGRAKPLPSPHAAFKGEMRRDVLAVLRPCGEPATSLEIARKILAARKLPDDPKTVTMFRKRVGAALWKLKAKGIVEEVAQVGDYKGWRVTLL